MCSLANFIRGLQQQRGRERVEEEEGRAAAAAAAVASSETPARVEELLARMRVRRWARAAVLAIEGTRVTAVAPLPMTTTFLPA